MQLNHLHLRRLRGAGWCRRTSGSGEALLVVGVFSSFNTFSPLRLGVSVRLDSRDRDDTLALVDMDDHSDSQEVAHGLDDEGGARQ
jgi:hypothetical protein